MTEERIWNPGPPPHIGWWNASVMEALDMWRWWNGKHWSDAAQESSVARLAGTFAKRRESAKNVEWTDYWPEGARVPRVDPRNMK